MRTSKITDEEKTALIVWLNIEHRDYGHRLSQKYGDTLHGLYIKLTGKKHDIWGNR